MKHNIQLEYDGGRKYKILVNKAVEKTFESYGIFIVVRNFVGVTVKRNEIDVLLTFTNMEHAKNFLKRHIEPDVEEDTEYRLRSLVTLNEKLEKVECLSEKNGGLNIDFLPDKNSQVNHYYRFSFYSSASTPYAPAVMFITKYVGVREYRGKPNHIALVTKIGKETFYFGIVFAENDDFERFTFNLDANGLLSGNLRASITDRILSKLFDA